MTTAAATVTHQDQPLPLRSAAHLSAGFATGEVTPTEVVESVIERVQERDGLINAFYRFAPAEARRAAEESTRRWERGEQLGPLDGVPVTIKENIAKAGVPMPAGTAAGEPVVPRHNAPITDRVLEEGGVILGTTTMPDWGMLSSGVSSLHGITRSPWNSAWTTGGSSAGAGAAAAAGFGPLHVGSDIGGSVRLPATWLGLVALKPSAGRIPIDTPYRGRVAGPITRTVRDAAMFMKPLSRPDLRDPTAMPHEHVDWMDLEGDVAGLRVGVHVQANAGADAHPDIVRAVQEAAELFARAGAEVVPIMPFISQRMLDDIDNFWRVRFWVQYRRMSAEEQGRVLPYIAEWCARGADVDGADVIEMYHSFNEMQAATVAATAPYDIVLSPVAPMAAFPAEDPMPSTDPLTTMTHIAFAVPYNMSGQPAASINCGFMADGRPIGLQIAGRRFQDLQVLRAAAWYESNRPESASPVWPS